MKKDSLKVWAFPSLCFMFFLYGMAFVLIYTYNQNFGESLVADKKSRGEIDPEAIRKEIMNLKLN
ncbi:hypothetical protein CQA57_01075 [Helicobacter anseris]|uniref:Uncharacterized protein n=1 Tax=Helicobacter anseris TaxID=375926 RepID=A0A3D8JCT0_9HELI|nr:hypothetical protein [Helicobacter anseris]RDU74674.1 hypothetical protein CQA57_01075 [Helicobacter anseris]